MKRFLLIFVLWLTAATVSGQNTGTVVRVIDGDTFELQDGRRVRLQGIDAPEAKQPYGDKSASLLRLMVLDRQVELKDVKKAAWGRLEARVIWHGTDINGMVVWYGGAWVDQRYKHDAKWIQWQSAAKSAHRGLWAGAAVAPWDWRDGVRSLSSRPAIPVLPPQPTILRRYVAPMQQFSTPYLMGDEWCST